MAVDLCFGNRARVFPAAGALGFSAGPFSFSMKTTHTARFKAYLRGPFCTYRTPTLGQTGSLGSGNSIFCGCYLLKDPDAVSDPMLKCSHTDRWEGVPLWHHSGGTSLEKEDGHQVNQLHSLLIQLPFNQMVDFQGRW